MKRYKCIAADPPWPFGDKLPGKTRGAVKNYEVMTVDDICALARGKWEDVEEGGPGGWQNMGSKLVEVTNLALCGKRFKLDDDCLLFLWRVSSQVEEAYRVVRAWGFVPKSEIVWVKTTGKRIGHEIGGNVMDIEIGKEVVEHKLHFGMGRYTRGSHETCIIAARGSATKLITNHSTRSVFFAPVPRHEDGKIIHSAKPPEFYKIVEALAPGPRLELFARERRKGWKVAGRGVPTRTHDE